MFVSESLQTSSPRMAAALQAAMSAVLGEGERTDYTLVCGDEEFRVHSFILIARYVACGLEFGGLSSDPSHQVEVLQSPADQRDEGERREVDHRAGAEP